MEQVENALRNYTKWKIFIGRKVGQEVISKINENCFRSDHLFWEKGTVAGFFSFFVFFVQITS